MPEITIIAAGGNPDVAKREKIDNIIQGASNGIADNVSHIAGLFAGFTWEAQGVIVGSEPYPGFWPQSKDRFLQPGKTAKFIAIEVVDYAAVLMECRKLTGMLYGYDDCAAGGLYEATGKELPDNPFTGDCSASWSRILRNSGNIWLPEIKEAQSITPEKFYRYAMDTANGRDITDQVLSGGEIPGFRYGVTV